MAAKYEQKITPNWGHINVAHQSIYDP